MNPEMLTKWLIRWGGTAAMIAVLTAGAGDGVAQESVAVRAALVTGTLPLDDPNAAAWNNAAPAVFPMSPQVHWPERIQQVTVQDLTVRALHDGTQIAVLLEYADPTEDPDDAAAIEFMVGDKKAHFAHGQPMLLVEGGPVNIWYWKSKDNKGVDLWAKGFGTLRPHEHQDVKAKGEYANGKWRVVFSRSLATDHPDEDAQITPGQFINIAFAVWDGRKDDAGQVIEKGSQKAVSSWWYFRAEPPPDYSGYVYAGVAAVLALGFQFVLIRKLKEGQSA
ncbi:MAG: ethylbenzene dehydrogenase-related protein [Nitrospira sp.]|nr:ethylbenzene dehydrogenase-related protein [Nitrospira sp.]MCP9463810.1 ethylbenzene dehydrogenase-related protein [Nitrospira sp.]